MVWGGTLMVIAHAMGTLYEKKEARVRELREANKESRDTYKGVMVLLRQMTTHDKYIHDHSFRVAYYAATIAKTMGFDEERIDIVRDASLLHDIGKMEISRELLYKKAPLTQSEYEQIQKHAEKGAQVIEPVGRPLRRIIPIILAHHDKFDGSGYRPTQGEQIPLEARVISVANVYDSMTSEHPYRKAMSPPDAKETITRGSGTDFDPAVVEAFLKAYQSGELEIDFTALDMRRP
jgi:putative nucleotidyltransferase with HDIG domain